jgi:hypothetical protein
MVNVKAYFREAERLEREMGQSSARRNQQQVTASRVCLRSAGVWLQSVSASSSREQLKQTGD